MGSWESTPGTLRNVFFLDGRKLKNPGEPHRLKKQKFKVHEFGMSFSLTSKQHKTLFELLTFSTCKEMKLH